MDYPTPASIYFLYSIPIDYFDLSSYIWLDEYGKGGRIFKKAAGRPAQPHVIPTEGV
jgi:hypothetical protein